MVDVPILHSNIGSGVTATGNGLTTMLNELTELHPVVTFLILIQIVCGAPMVVFVYEFGSGLTWFWASVSVS